MDTEHKTHARVRKNRIAQDIMSAGWSTVVEQAGNHGLDASDQR